MEEFNLSYGLESIAELNSLICEKCGENHNGSYGSGRFCSNICARSFSISKNRAEINKKISKGVKANVRKKPRRLKCILNCKHCNKQFEVAYARRNKIFCSVSCVTSWKNIYLKMCHKAGLASAAKRVKRSKNEILFFEFCFAFFENVEHNKNIFNGWDADVILNDEKVAILWNGKWHYEKITEKHSLIQVQNRDKIKMKEIVNSGY